MARRERIALSDLSGEHLDIEQIDSRRRVVEAAVEAYRFLGFTQSEALAEKDALLDELRRSASMDVFGALEAAFQIDFLQRYHGREDDEVSLASKDLYRNNRSYVPLSAILVAWEEKFGRPATDDQELDGRLRIQELARAWTLPESEAPAGLQRRLLACGGGIGHLPVQGR